MDREWRQRQMGRKKGHDYTTGSYFVTICTYDRDCVFGKVTNGEVQLNVLGAMTAQCWKGIPNHFPQVSRDSFVVMPNHIHGILHLGRSDHDEGGARHGAPREHDSPQTSVRRHRVSLGVIVNQFKGAVTNRVRRDSGIAALVWQRDFNDHIIRDLADLLRVRAYILDNPSRWTRRGHNQK
jgi:REP element-mobilizing transposase RayT